MKFDILNRFAGTVQFTAEIDCDTNADRSVKLGLAVRVALEQKADLSGANLYGANLRAANLSDANLSGAYLSGANLYGATGNMREVKSLAIDTYPVTYTATHLQIGCEHHPIADWWTFTRQKIAGMDGAKASTFWKTWKPVLQALISASPATPTGKEDADTQVAA